VFGVASTATYNQYETIDAPFLILYKIGEQKFCVIPVDFIFSKALTQTDFLLRKWFLYNM